MFRVELEFIYIHTHRYVICIHTYTCVCVDIFAVWVYQSCSKMVTQVRLFSFFNSFFVQNRLHFSVTSLTTYEMANSASLGVLATNIQHTTSATLCFQSSRLVCLHIGANFMCNVFVSVGCFCVIILPPPFSRKTDLIFPHFYFYIPMVLLFLLFPWNIFCRKHWGNIY